MDEIRGKHLGSRAEYLQARNPDSDSPGTLNQQRLGDELRRKLATHRLTPYCEGGADRPHVRVDFSMISIDGTARGATSLVADVGPARNRPEKVVGRVEGVPADVVLDDIPGTHYRIEYKCPECSATVAISVPDGLQALVEGYEREFVTRGLRDLPILLIRRLISETRRAGSSG